MTALLDRVRAAFRHDERPEAWVTLRPEADVLAEVAAVQARLDAGEHLPLAGRLLAVKDNIDVAGLPTTAGCPAYSYRPERSATAVQRLLDAGAVVLGKTNLDQFATGLVGTRSPYGVVRDVRDPAKVSGGSSSGSAVVVALGQVDLALGTDTAGSGRVPAAFQGIVGVKPSLGLVPTDGVVPACRSFDCVSVFARTLPEAQEALAVMADPLPPTAPLGAPPSPVVLVPERDQLVHLNEEWRDAFERAAKTLEAGGATLRPVALGPFLAAATLLYDGTFVAERYAAVGAFVDAHPEDVDPTVGAIVRAARRVPAAAYVADLDRLARLRRQALEAWGDADALLLPTVPQHPTLAAVQAEPVAVNSRLGTYTNFCNLFDLAAVAVPAGAAGEDQFGVTVFAKGHHDAVAAAVAALLTGDEPGGPFPAVGSGLPVAVFGAHLSGQPLNGQLATGRLLGPVRTSADYRMVALSTVPPKPGLVRVPHGGASVAGELWELPRADLGPFLAALPSPMALGRVHLSDGREVTGFLCEQVAAERGEDITAYASWAAYLAATRPPP